MVLPSDTECYLAGGNDDGRPLLAVLFFRWRDLTRRYKPSPPRSTQKASSGGGDVTAFMRRLRQHIGGDASPEEPVSAQPELTATPISLQWECFREKRTDIAAASTNVRPASIGSMMASLMTNPRTILTTVHETTSTPDQLVSLMSPSGSSQALCPYPIADTPSMTVSGHSFTLNMSTKSPLPLAVPLASPTQNDSDTSVGLWAQALHSDRYNPRVPRPDAELRRAPHLMAFLKQSCSNGRSSGLVTATTSFYPHCYEDDGASVYKDRSVGDKTPPTGQRLPADMRSELERRAELRRKRHEQTEKLRRERASTRQQTEQRQQEKRQHSLEQQRRCELDSFRERRRREEELRHRRQRGHEVLLGRQRRADVLRGRQLARRALRALLRNVQESRRLAAAGTEVVRRAVQRRAFLAWRHQRIQAAAQQEERAYRWYQRRLMAGALRRWKQYVHQQRQLAQAAADLRQLLRLQAALRGWRGALALVQVRRRRDWQRAQKLDTRLTCADALHRWRRLPDALRQERAAEMRRDRLRRIVREMLPDFALPPPPSMAVVEPV